MELHPAAAALIAVAAVLTAGATVWRFGLGPIVRLGLELRELLQDLRGVPPRPGHPAVPGLFAQASSNGQQLEHLADKLEEHLAWARQTSEHLDRVVEEHLVQSEVTRQEGHREAAHLWDAIGEIARHGGLTIHRPESARTRRTDPPEENP